MTKRVGLTPIMEVTMATCCVWCADCVVSVESVQEKVQEMVLDDKKVSFTDVVTAITSSCLLQ